MFIIVIDLLASLLLALNIGAVRQPPCTSKFIVADAKWVRRSKGGFCLL
jgi:hypothetical protein